MRYGRISFDDADALDREPRLMQERRFGFKRGRPEGDSPRGQVCRHCNLLRAPNQFRLGEFRFEACDICRGKHPELRKPIQAKGAKA